MRLPSDLVIALLAFVTVGALHVLAENLEPPLVSLEEVPSREGARVMVEGRVLGVAGRHVVLADATHRMGAFLPEAGAVARGDLVRVVGISARLHDGPGLSGERVEVLEPAASRILSPADLGASPAERDGARVLVEGEIRDDSLVGGGGRVRLRGEPAPSREGDWLARGVFHYRPEEAAYVLRVESWTRPR